MTAPLALDPAFCPLCGQSNQCAMEIERATGVKQPPCWCTVAFNRDALARLPPEARGQACICSVCARPIEMPGQTPKETPAAGSPA